MIYEKAPAKINLALDVLHKREDGYHEVNMIMTTIDLADRIELKSLEQNEIKIVSDNRFVPDDERNLAYKAAFIIKEKLGIQKGVQITIDKQIPVAAGLAGGSSDAAAVLRGLNKIWKLQLTHEQLAEIGSEIGSDVPFCVYSSTACVTGRGEKIHELPAPPPCWIVLAKPSIGVSTRVVYEQLTLEYLNHPDIEGMKQAIQKQDYSGMTAKLGNVLETVTFRLHPEVKTMKERMLKAGADNVLMSGSGPTVFGLTRKDQKAERIYNSLKGFCNEVYVVRMLGQRLPVD
ncbi:4-(cytidine 5'-diphospho)-2-C-methyl-D-erythritol kinase [Melghiribacillus thermohalophilus]|nr:4-(cytidine 5'-diphospho)-2-C-methyl-D-erythritol kinase [Melghiribacillus thermohalophilus]